MSDPTQLASDEIVLDFEQRQRANQLVEYVLEYPESSANELIYLRDRVRALEATIRVKDADFQRVYADREHVRDHALQLESALYAVTGSKQITAGSDANG